MTREGCPGPYSIIRRRHCRKCDHRFYSGQSHEIVVPYVSWHNDKAIAVVP